MSNWCLKGTKDLIFTFSLQKLQNGRLTRANFNFFWKLLKKWNKGSLTPSKITIILFFKTIRRFLSITCIILNFHVFLKYTQKLKTNTCGFQFVFKKFKKKCKMLCLPPSKSQLSLFSNKHQNWGLKWKKYLIPCFPQKKFQYLRITHANFYFCFSEYLEKM